MFPLFYSDTPAVPDTKIKKKKNDPNVDFVFGGFGMVSNSSALVIMTSSYL